MLDVLYWLAAVEVIGLIIVPLAFSIFSKLPDKGYCLTKPLGLLLASWILWMLGSIQIIPNNVYSLWLIIIGISAASAIHFSRNRKAILTFISGNRSTIILSEGVFLLGYAFWVLYRLYDPAIYGTEKPMDFAFLNAAIIADFFPPEDPWLSGHAIPYYYFGYLIMANISEVTSIPTQISYNLSLALVPAMAAQAMFGLIFSLVRLNGVSLLRSSIAALLSPMILLFAGNLEGGLEFLKTRGLGSEGFWQWIGIKGLDNINGSGWIPSDHLWWWRGTRVIDSLSADGDSLDYTITEFPFFSFLLGDLHPHVMAIPFVLLFLSFGLNFLMFKAPSGYKSITSTVIVISISGFLLGGVGFINTWDLFTLSVFWASLVLVRMLIHESKLTWYLLIENALLALVPGILSVLLYLPFYMSLDSQASGIVPVGQYSTRPVHFTVIWGSFVLALLGFLLLELHRLATKRLSVINGSLPTIGGSALSLADRSPQSVIGQMSVVTTSAIALSFVLAPFAIWASWQIGWSTLIWSIDPMTVVLQRFINVLPLMLIAFMSVYLLIIGVQQRVAYPRIFVLLVMFLGIMLIIGPEFLRVDDLFHNRMNTIFKTYYQAWIFLSVAVVFCVQSVISSTFMMNMLLRTVFRIWLGLLAFALLISLYYPAAAIWSKSGHFHGNPTLDGLHYVMQDNPGEYSAILWFNDNASVGEVLLESVGDSWSDNARISSSTGLPSVLGWPWHEHQWRGSTAQFYDRESDVRTIYETLDTSEALRLLYKYDVRYVVVGVREQTKYGNVGMAKFGEIADEVFVKGDISIYRLKE